MIMTLPAITEIGCTLLAWEIAILSEYLIFKTKKKNMILAINMSKNGLTINE